MALSPDGKFIVSGSNGSLKVFDLHNKSCTTLKMLIPVTSTSLCFPFSSCTSPAFTHLLTEMIGSVAISADSRLIVSGSNDKSIKVFDMNTKQQLHHFDCSGNISLILCLFTHLLIGGLSSVAISADSRIIISGSYDKSISVFDMNTKQQLHHFENAHSCNINFTLCFFLLHNFAHSQWQSQLTTGSLSLDLTMAPSRSLICTPKGSCTSSVMNPVSNQQRCQLTAGSLSLDLTIIPSRSLIS